VLPDIQGYSDWSGSLDQPGELFVSAAGDGWKLQVDGSDVASTEALGWANSFPVEQAGDATLRFDTPVTRWLALAGQVALWLIAFAYLLRVRVREDEGTDLIPAPTPAPEAPAHVVIGADLDDLFASGSTGGDLPTMAVPVVVPPAEPLPPEADEPTGGRRGRRRRSR
jgi:hypothetical protein